MLGHNSSPVDTVKSGVVLSWSVEPNWHGHRHLVNAVCEGLWRASGQEVALDPAFDRLLCLIGKPRRVEGWFDSEGEACIAHRRGLRKQGVLATFTCLGEGHWTTSPLSAKIVVDESKKARTLCFVGDLHREQCVVLELLTQHLVLTKWDHVASKVRVKVDPKSFAYPMEVSADDLRREQLAVQARDAAGVSEFRVTGSIRTAWYEAQRRDPSLTAALKKPEAPMVLAADGLLERDVSLKTGQTVTVPVVPNGLADANGVTWRRACYNAVHCGVLGAHRSADVTTKLLERAVWWPDLAKDVAAWVGKCLACIKGRSRPTKVEARAVKCGAESCWQEVSVDCEGPNREDREGLRYSLTYFDCLSHAVLLEPMRSLTHSEVRRAFVRCVLCSRTMPSLVRSDRGAEFKNALMAELSVMLGAEWRFSAPLRPCELGANERVHQEVQKVLGAVVRQVGSTVGDTWSDWLVVAEYVIDNTPGPHGYTPRDLERSWSLALPLERDVLRAALEFEPVSDWARGQFQQFAELSAAVKAYWDKSSAARAKLANRHRRTVDLKPGDRVVWNAPKGRSEGAGRVPWKPGLTGPWRVKDVRGHRLTLEPVPDVPGGTFSGAKGPMEAHAEDCILVPPDAEAAQPREPIVFEDEGHEGGDVSRPSLGQQVAGEAKQVEFTLTRRGRDFILRLGEHVAYRGARGGPKSCRLGRVTQVDQARAQVGVHRYLPEVSGVPLSRLALQGVGLGGNGRTCRDTVVGKLPDRSPGSALRPEARSLTPHDFLDSCYVRSREAWPSRPRLDLKAFPHEVPISLRAARVLRDLLTRKGVDLQVSPDRIPVPGVGLSLPKGFHLKGISLDLLVELRPLSRTDVLSRLHVRQRHLGHWLGRRWRWASRRRKAPNALGGAVQGIGLSAPKTGRGEAKIR